MRLVERSRGPHTVHDFAHSLAYSDRLRDADWWLPVYRHAFPNLASAVPVKSDGWAQRGGIDRVLTLECGRVISVDEKIRSQEWPDILLEQWSDEERRRPGWVQKPLAAEFIAYGFETTGLCYLLPVVPLQRAWRRNGKAWIGRYGVRRAQNAGYTSVSVPVPRAELMRAIADAMVLTPAKDVSVPDWAQLPLALELPIHA